MTMAQTKTANAPTTKRAPRTLAGTLSATDNTRAQLVAQYEAALRLMQEGKYDKAHAAFEKMLASGAGELSDRVRMYANACLLQSAKGKNTFASHEEHYDYAVSLLNDGHYEDAREQFKLILKENDKAD
jgi:TolA-binding protein